MQLVAIEVGYIVNIVLWMYKDSFSQKWVDVHISVIEPIREGERIFSTMLGL
jgi:hypothetical protein